MMFKGISQIYLSIIYPKYIRLGNSMDYNDAFNIGTIQLEPRLQEYLRRKRFNQENDIEPPITEEKEFCITPYDLDLIKRHSKGTKKLYTSRRLAKDPNFIKPDSTDFELANHQNDFKKDPRYKRLQKKMQSHKLAQQQIRNFEGIDEDYTIFHQTNPYDLKPEKRPQTLAKPYFDNNYVSTIPDNRNGFDVMMDSRDLVLGSSRETVKRSNTKKNSDNDRGQYCYSPNARSNNEHTYHHPPKISYNQRVGNNQLTVSGGMKHSREVVDIIGNIDTYNKHLNQTYDYVPGDMDLDTHTYTPGTRTNTQRENSLDYQAIPFGYGNGLPDISVEESLKGGIRDSSKKSIGFKNSFEHNFNYISPDISDYRHTVQMWPQNTRGQNREIARPNSASARHDRNLRNNILNRN